MKVDVTVRVSPQYAKHIIYLAWLLEEPDSIGPWWSEVIGAIHFWLEELAFESGRWEDDASAQAALSNMMSSGAIISFEQCVFIHDEEE